LHYHYNHHFSMSPLSLAMSSGGGPCATLSQRPTTGPRFPPRRTAAVLQLRGLVPRLVLALALPHAATAVFPVNVSPVAFSLTDEAGRGRSFYAELVDLVSSISGFLMPSTGAVQMAAGAIGAGVVSPTAPIRAVRDRGVHGRMHELHPRSANTFSTVASRHKGWPNGISLVAANGSEQDVLTPLVSGWVLVHGLGNHTNVVDDPQLAKLTRAVRDSVADSTDVCRSAVSITEVRSINVNLLDQSLHIGSSSSLLDRTLRSWKDWRGHRPPARPTHVNLTQLKLWYEVRIFDSLRATQDDVAARVDALQVYGRFADAGKQLSRAFTRTGVDFGPIIVLDDMGYASRDQLWRPTMTKDELLDCNEEMLLRSARVFHQYAIAAALFLGAITACAGSAVFTIKHPTNVPSRLNPLSRDA